MGVRPVTLGPSLHDALADRVLRAPWVVLAGGSFGMRHLLLQDTLEPLAFLDAPAGDAYRDGARRITVVEPDLRRGVEAFCAALDAPRSDDARRVIVVEEAHALLRMEPMSRARVVQALIALVGEGRDCCVVLATNEHALAEVTAVFAGAWGAESVVRLPPAVWPRRIAWAAALLTLTAGIAWGESHRRWRAEVRAVGIQQAQDRATLPLLSAARATRESQDEQRALAAAMAEIELRSRGGQGEGISRLMDDRGAGWAGGPWVLRGPERETLSARYLPDGTLFVARHGLAQVLDAHDGRVLRSFPCRGGYTVPTLSYDLRRLVTTDRESVRVWDVATGRQRWARRFRAEFASLSGDGSRIALTERDTVTVLDVEGDRIVARGAIPGAADVEISADGELLYETERLGNVGNLVFRSARITSELRWNRISSEVVVRRRLSLRENHALQVESNDRDPLDQRLLDARGATVRRIDGMRLYDGRVSADGRRFLGNGDQLHVFDARSGERLTTIPTSGVHTPGMDFRGLWEFGMDDRGELVLSEGPLGAGHVWGVAQARWVTAISQHPNDAWTDLTTNPLNPEEFVRVDGRTGVARWRYPMRTRLLGRTRIPIEPADEAISTHKALLVGEHQIDVLTYANDATPTHTCFDVADARRLACPAQEAMGTNESTLSLVARGSAIAVDAERALEYGADGSLTLRDTQRNRVVAQLGSVHPGAGREFGERALLGSRNAPTVRLAADHSRGLHFTWRNALRVWDARTGRHFASLVPTSGARFIDAAFTPDAQRVVTLDARGGLERWHLRPEDPRALLDEHLAETNLRVCRSDLRVVVVPLPLDAETRRSPWAPSRACASGR